MGIGRATVKAFFALGTFESVFCKHAATLPEHYESEIIEREGLRMKPIILLLGDRTAESRSVRGRFELGFEFFEVFVRGDVGFEERG